MHTPTHTHTPQVFIHHKKEMNHFACRNNDGTGKHHFKQNQPDSERQIPHGFANELNIRIKDMKVEAEKRSGAREVG